MIYVNKIFYTYFILCSNFIKFFFINAFVAHKIIFLKKYLIQQRIKSSILEENFTAIIIEGNKITFYAHIKYYLLVRDVLVESLIKIYGFQI